ncbi:MAG: TIGR03759 family integrating conjugative element protein [Burkholderiales bacterium]|jgi:integrating conjugative element protein (TIGR03759 family)|nr:TIGR03759 family integrating conjugative element protein [Burkholderiales bacterium]
MKTSASLLFLWLVLLVSTGALAQKSDLTPNSMNSQIRFLPSLVTKPLPEQDRLVEEDSQSRATQIRRWEEQSKRWSLTSEDWARYEEIMKGPRGYWSPNLDPLTALGVEARSENERVRLAQIQVRMEAERAERELSYQKTYDAVFKKVYGNLLPFAPMPAQAPKGPPRVALFVKTNCPECDKKAKLLQDSKTPFDVYMVGSGGKDAVIRDWAKNAGISPALVKDKTITLNHDNGTLVSVGGNEKDKFPFVYQMIEGTGQWVRTE